MNSEYSIHQWKFLSTENEIKESYGSVDNYIKLFSEHNSVLIHSMESSVLNYGLTLTVQFNGKECYKQILKHGYCVLWMHDDYNPGNMSQILPEHLSQ